jgi:hypothetical protein
MTLLTLFDAAPVKFKISYQNNHGQEFINVIVIDETSVLSGRNNIGELWLDMRINPVSKLPICTFLEWIT